MKKLVWITSFLLLIVLINTSLAQNNQLQFQKIDGPNGKPIGKIRDITQDPHGYMWFSGEGANCVYRYDGIRITEFRHNENNSNSLGGTNINSVFADDAGIIWIGMREGLDRLDPATGVFKHFRHDPDDPGSLGGGVNPILRDSQGRLWLGTNGGLDMLDEKIGKFIHYRNDPGNPKSLSNNIVWNLYEDRQGVLWIATGHPFDSNRNPEEGGLNRLEPNGTFTQFKHDPYDPQTLISNKVRAMFEDSRGVLWVGTKGDGLHTMDRKTGKFVRHTFDPRQPEKLSRPPLKRMTNLLLTMIKSLLFSKMLWDLSGLARCGQASTAMIRSQKRLLIMRLAMGSPIEVAGMLTSRAMVFYGSVHKRTIYTRLILSSAGLTTFPCHLPPGVLSKLWNIHG